MRRPGYLRGDGIGFIDAMAEKIGVALGWGADSPKTYDSSRAQTVGSTDANLKAALTTTVRGLISRAETGGFPNEEAFRTARSNLREQIMRAGRWTDSGTTHTGSYLPQPELLAMLERVHLKHLSTQAREDGRPMVAPDAIDPATGRARLDVPGSPPAPAPAPTASAPTSQSPCGMPWQSSPRKQEFLNYVKNYPNKPADAAGQQQLMCQLWHNFSARDSASQAPAASTGPSFVDITTGVASILTPLAAMGAGIFQTQQQVKLQKDLLKQQSQAAPQYMPIQLPAASAQDNTILIVGLVGGSAIFLLLLVLLMRPRSGGHPRRIKRAKKIGPGRKS